MIEVLEALSKPIATSADALGRFSGHPDQLSLVHFGEAAARIGNPHARTSLFVLESNVESAKLRGQRSAGRIIAGWERWSFRQSNHTLQGLMLLDHDLSSTFGIDDGAAVRSREATADQRLQPEQEANRHYEGRPAACVVTRHPTQRRVGAQSTKAGEWHTLEQR